MNGMSLGFDQVVAFVPTTDLERAREFYGSVLGLTVEQTNPYACVLRAGSTRLRERDLVERGISFERFDGMAQNDQGVWTTSGGDKVAWFKDPDGNTLSLTQHVGDAAP